MKHSRSHVRAELHILPTMLSEDRLRGGVTKHLVRGLLGFGGLGRACALVRGSGASVRFGVDAGDLVGSLKLGKKMRKNGGQLDEDDKFDRIVFNFPHVGLGIKDDKFDRVVFNFPHSRGSASRWAGPLTAFYGSSCANNGEDALNTPEYYNMLRDLHYPPLRVRTKPPLAATDVVCVSATCWRLRQSHAHEVILRLITIVARRSLLRTRRRTRSCCGGRGGERAREPGAAAAVANHVDTKGNH
eukprot:1183636-Prorocentrum_minimum.AAC.1